MVLVEKGAFQVSAKFARQQKSSETLELERTKVKCTQLKKTCVDCRQRQLFMVLSGQMVAQKVK
jgi:hypothetical protein